MKRLAPNEALCPDCGGEGKVTAVYAEHPDSGRRSGFYDERCDTCDGLGIIDATCDYCDGQLDRHGYCAACEEHGGAAASEQLVHVELKALGNRRNRVVA